MEMQILGEIGEGNERIGTNSPLVSNSVRSKNAPGNRLAAPIGARDGAERDEGRGVFAREPDAALGGTMAEGLDVFVEADFVGVGRFRCGIGLCFARRRRGRFVLVVEGGVAGVVFVGRGAGLEIGVAAPTGEFVVLPVCAEDADGMARWGGGGVIG